VEKGRQSWHEFLLATGEALFELPSIRASEVRPVPVAAPAAAPAVPVADPSPAEAPSGAADASAESSIDSESSLASPERQSVPALPVTGMDQTTASQSVWVPFRSQMSAEGFARRLTGELDHRFSVSREGPGRYQVMFSYANEVERLNLLDRVQAVTGEDGQ